MMKKTALFILFAIIVSLSLYAQNSLLPGVNLETPRPLLRYLATAPATMSRSIVLIDAETGTALYVKNPHEEIPPASLTKLMTMHLVQTEMAARGDSFDTVIPIGYESWARNQPPHSSLMFLAPGQRVTLGELLFGLAVPSGNDASVAAAMYVASSVPEFAEMMNREARRMGLQRTRFVEPSGISEHNMTTAAEFAEFSRQYLRLHPQNLGLFHSVQEFAFPLSANVPPAFYHNPRTIVQANRNGLLRTFPGTDGLKTGFIPRSGHNISLTAERDGTRFIAVILGAPSPGGERNREIDGEALLSWAFRNFRTVRLNTPPVEPARLWAGRQRQASLVLTEPAIFTAGANRAARINFTTEIFEPLVAPLPAGYPAGWLVINDDEGELHRIRLVTSAVYEQGNFFRRLWDTVRLFFIMRRR